MTSQRRPFTHLRSVRTLPRANDQLHRRRELAASRAAVRASASEKLVPFDPDKHSIWDVPYDTDHKNETQTLSCHTKAASHGAGQLAAQSQDTSKSEPMRRTPRYSRMLLSGGDTGLPVAAALGTETDAQEVMEALPRQLVPLIWALRTGGVLPRVLWNRCATVLSTRVRMAGRALFACPTGPQGHHSPWPTQHGRQGRRVLGAGPMQKGL